MKHHKLHILRVLEAGPKTCRALSQVTEIDYQTLVVIVNRLVKEALVEPMKRRGEGVPATIYQLTTRGRGQLRDARIAVGMEVSNEAMA